MGFARFDASETGYVYLIIDGIPVAYSYVGDSDIQTNSYQTMSINTIQSVAVGQTVTLEWTPGGGDPFLYGNIDKPTHWSAVYLGPSTPPVPECEYAGQVFEYPGSCRDYYQCGADGSVSKLSCCPGNVFVEEEAFTKIVCVPEDFIDIDEVCHSEDTC